jgi:hypothetical protein
MMFCREEAAQMFGAFRAKTTEMVVLSIRVDTIAPRAAVNSESASCKDCVKLAIDPRRPTPLAGYMALHVAF